MVMVTLSEDAEGKEILRANGNGDAVWGRRGGKDPDLRPVRSLPVRIREPSWFLVYRGGLKMIPLREDSGLLTLPTKPLLLDRPWPRRNEKPTESSTNFWKKTRREPMREMIIVSK
jgi:hypothetical protein